MKCLCCEREQDYGSGFCLFHMNAISNLNYMLNTTDKTKNFILKCLFNNKEFAAYAKMKGVVISDENLQSL